LTISSYLGGSGNESPAGIALDAAGNVFVAGYANSKNFPTANALRTRLPDTTNAGGSFIAKINLSIKAPKGSRVTGVLVKGKKLVVNGEGFGEGSVILINGEEQETSIDDQPPRQHVDEQRREEGEPEPNRAITGSSAAAGRQNLIPLVVALVA